MTILDTAAEVLGVEQQPLPYYTLRLRMEQGFAQVSPGQFVMIQSDPLDPYLRRAFSVFDVSKAEPRSSSGEGERDPGPQGSHPRTIELLGKVIGPGTLRLSRLSVHERRAVLGPLGRGFRVVSASGRAALVAGGVGSAALLLLARELRDRGLEFDFYYGGRSSVDLACGERFRRLTLEAGGEYIETTQDGSAGDRGLVTEALEQRLDAGRYGFLYSCGPMPLLRRVAGLGEEYGVGGQAALETPMGCGFGACIGCAVPHRSRPYALCCKDGPVFDLEEVDWDRIR
jgi:dihydroorotate dehydrogenase electron transfer subunit